VHTHGLYSARHPAAGTTASDDVTGLAGTVFPPGLPDPTTTTRHPAAGSHAAQITAGDEALRIEHAGNRLHLAGDIDEFTHAGLLAALSHLSSEPGDIHIHLAGVDFCNVAGLRALVLLSTPPQAMMTTAGASSCTGSRHT
jgi:ABC-type transporter Mla MlaB component